MRIQPSSPSRREFLQLAAGAGAGAALGLSLPSQFLPPPPTGALKILIFGGTGFVGPSVVRPALLRKHELTLFNRGRSRKHLFPEVERIQGDQDPSKGDGLKQLAQAVKDGRTWDAVIDDIAYYPTFVKPRLELLQKATKHYILTSSISAYASNATAGQAEDAPLAKVDDESRTDMGKNYEFYGGLKAACERLAEQHFPGATCIVRPGYIVGPEDPTDRFTYWPVRYQRSGEMLWPGKPDDLLQIIDVRDLGEWLVHIVENRLFGVFNACGPTEPWSMGGLLATCKELIPSKTTPIWVSAEFLRERGEAGEGELPIWAPSSGDTVGYHAYSNAKALAAGLKCREPKATTKDTMTWFASLPAKRTDESRDNVLRAGLKPEDEAKMLAEWKAKTEGNDKK